jgi:hypothetical protein
MGRSARANCLIAPALNRFQSALVLDYSLNSLVCLWAKLPKISDVISKITKGSSKFIAIL